MSFFLIEVAKVWFVFSFSLGCWTCLNLAVGRRGDYRIKKIIMVFIILLLLPPLNGYAAVTSSQPVFLLMAATHQLTWAYGPLMVLLINQVLLRPNNPTVIVMHALPFLLALIYGLLNRPWMSFTTLMCLLFTQVFAYLGYASYLLISNRQRLVNLSTQHKYTTYYWLLYLVAGLTLVMLIDMGFYFNIYTGNLHPELFSALVGSVVAIYVNTIALFAVYQPSVFFHETAEENPPLEAEAEAPVKPQLRSVELSPAAAQELDRQLQQLVTLHKPHLDETVSLPKLASLLGVTTHQLSELLNVHKATSFYDFMNELRYRESLNFLTDANRELTIADIAYQSGFNNRNSFYKVFKEKTGLTPSQYKKLSTAQ